MNEKDYIREKSLETRKKMALAIIIPEYASFLNEKKDSSENLWDEENLAMGDALNILAINPFEEINLSKDELRIISKADLFLKNAFINYLKLLEIADKPLVQNLETYEKNNIYQELNEDPKKVDISFLLDCFVNLKKIVTPTKDDLVFKYLSNKWSLMTTKPLLPYTFIAAALNEDYPDNDTWAKVNEIIINENNTDTYEKKFIGLVKGFSMMNFFGGDGNKEKYIAMLNIPTKEEIDKNIKNSKLLSLLELRKSIIEDLFHGANEKLEEKLNFPDKENINTKPEPTEFKKYNPNLENNDTRNQSSILTRLFFMGFTLVGLIILFFINFMQ